MHKDKLNQDVFILALCALIFILLGISYEWMSMSVLGMDSCQAWSLLAIAFHWLRIIVLGMALHMHRTLF